MSCSENPIFIGILFTIVGAYGFYLGIMCWIKPNAKIVQQIVIESYPRADEADPLSRFLGFTREQAGPVNLRVFKLLGPLNGGVFFLVGVWLTITNVGCGVHLPNLFLLFGTLSYSLSLGDLASMGISGGIGFWNSYRFGARWCVPIVLCALVFGFAGSQAAAFHTGIESSRWFAISMVALFLAGVLFIAYERFTRTRS